MIVTAENREQHFRSNNKFYVAGWVANEQCENPQTLPESCKDNPVIVKQNIGTIDYIKGEIMLSPIKIISTEVNRGESLIEISANPYSNDVIGKQDLYLQLDTNNVTISTSKPSKQCYNQY